MMKLGMRILRKILNPFSGVMHDFFGKFRCSICKKKILYFNPLSSYYFDNFEKYGHKMGISETCNIGMYSCPRCGAADRDRLSAIYLHQFFNRQLDSKTPFNMLKFGPNRLLSSFIISELSGHSDFHYRTVDFLQDGVNDKADIQDMHIYKDCQFDFFICSHVLEHVPDDRKALRELYRILRKGGQGILMVPINLSCDEIDEDSDCNDIAERWRRFGQFDHVRKYSKQGFIDRIIEAGFDLEQLGQHEFGAQEFIKYGISQQSVLYIVKKPQML